MTFDGARTPATPPAGRGETGALDPVYDVDVNEDVTWPQPAVADSIGFSASAARRLAEPGRACAFVLERIEGTYSEISAGYGRSIVLQAGLYGLVNQR